MAYDGRVYRILIASPSDVEEEREIIVRLIQEWNDLHSYSRKVVLLPLRWETHTAPEYGTRPQEVINRAIVDQCDLLVGVFWTRLGSPTGHADSGTLEEIERAGQAGKPIMLYFSKMGIDPEEMDLDQMRKLTEFKEKTYPNSLTESYKSLIDFRDKVAKQLELKIRDLQKADTSGLPPISFALLSRDSFTLSSDLTRNVKCPVVTDLESVLASEKKEVGRSHLDAIVEERIKTACSFPIDLAMHNKSVSGIRNLFVQVSIEVDQGNADISEVDPRLASLRPATLASAVEYFLKSKALSDGSRDSDTWDAEGLIKDGDRWVFSFEWDALQPQRVRRVKQHLFITAKQKTRVLFRAKVHADGFPQPVELSTTLNVIVEKNEVTLKQLLPNFESILAAGDVIDAEYEVKR